MFRSQAPIASLSLAAAIAVAVPPASAEFTGAIEEGIENPNSRPRAQDLTTTCVSMAVHGVEPNEGIWIRVRQILDGLSDPW